MSAKPQHDTLARQPRAARRRALVKAVTWRVLGTLDTFVWSWLVIGHPAGAGQIASLETFTKIGLFYRMNAHGDWRRSRRIRICARG